MADLPTHAHRWEHRTHAAVTTHWHGDRVVVGPIEKCETCKETRDE
jgi:hypothetical protein